MNDAPSYYSIIYEILNEIFLSGNYEVKSVFNKKIERFNSLKDKFKFKASIRNIVSGVVKNKILLERVINWYSVKPLGKFKRKEKIVLYSGIYEILFSSRPAYALVDEIVSYSKKQSGNNFGNFVNAFLKKISEEKSAILEKINKLDFETKYSLPEWFIELLKKREYLTNRLEEILKSYHSSPNYFLRINTEKRSENQVKDMLNQEEVSISTDKTGLPENCLKILKLNRKISELSAVKNGFAYVQDVSSQICSSICAFELNDMDSPKIFFDVCSAPGGKLMTVYNLSKNKKNISYLSMDSDVGRINLMKKNIIHNFSDAAVFKIINGNFNFFPVNLLKSKKKCAVLFDAPCSGSGIIGRYPGKLFSMTSKDIAVLAGVQISGLKKIIESAVRGAVIIYSVCSILYEETFKVIETATESFKNAVSIRIDNELLKGNNNYYQTDKGVLIYPSSETDGFFIAKIKIV